jgi:hypothetical protein
MRLAYAAIILLAVLLISGCGRKPTNADLDCNKYMDRVLRSECIYNKSMALLNPVNCKDIPDPKVRIQCIDDISVKLRGENYCMNQDKISLKENCERKVGEAIKADKLKAVTSST